MSATTPEYVITKHELPKEFHNSELFDMIRSPDGFVYIATGAGLLEWDGLSFKSFNSLNTPGFISDRIQNLHLSKKGDLWLIRRNHQITLKEGLKFTTFSLPTETGPLRSYFIDASDIPWILTNDLVYKFDPDSLDFEVFESLAGFGKTYLIGINDVDTPYFLTESGLVEYQNGILRLILGRSRIPVQLSQIVSVHFTEYGSVFIGHLNGYVEINLVSGSVQSRIDEGGLRVFRFVPESKSTTLGFANSGVFRFSNPSSGTTFNATSQSRTIDLLEVFSQMDFNELIIPFDNSNGGTLNNIGGNYLFKPNRQFRINQTQQPRFIYLDSEKTIWMGSRFGVIYKIRAKQVKTITNTPVGELLNVYSTVLSSDESLWFGCLVNGIFQMDGNTYTNWNRNNSSLPSNDVRYLFFHPKEKVMYASFFHQGLWKQAGKDWIEVHEIKSLIPVASTVIESMFYDQDRNRLYVGNDHQMLLFDDKGWRLYEPLNQASPERVIVIRKTELGELILGSRTNGLTLIDSTDTVLWNLKTQDGLASNTIRGVFVQSNDTLWLATENNGLNRLILNANRQVIDFKHVGINDGLSNQRLHRIIKDELDNLWISSNYGIMAVNIHNLNDYVDKRLDYLPITYIDEKSGMDNPEANGGVDNAGLLLKNGEILFPTQHGVVKIDPKSIAISRSSAVPEPRISRINSYSQHLDVNTMTKLRLPLGDREFTAFFQIPHFDNPDYRILRFKLEGFDTNWRPLKSQMNERYTRLKPGDYKLRLQLILPNGPPKEASLFIQVPPYLYERVWFQVLSSILLIVTIVFGTRYGYGKKLEFDEIRRQVDLKTAALEEINENKSRFFASITHEFKTPVSIIMGNIDRMLTEVNKEDIKPTLKSLKTVQRNSYKLLLLIDTLMGIAKLQDKDWIPERSSLVFLPVTQLLVDELSDLFKEKNLRINWSLDPDAEHAKIDMHPQTWERILYNLLVNAINFSPVDGTIHLEMTLSDRLYFSITDEGPGVSHNDSSTIFEYLKQGDVYKNNVGSGLGLYLAKELVSKHGGSISVTNKIEFGLGACFTLDFPYEHKPDNVDSIERELHSEQFNTNHPENDISSSFQAMENSQNKVLPLIMIVEDNRDYRDFLVSELSRQFRIETANSVKEALFKLNQIHPDLLISDVMMPEMSGFELVAKIRQIEHFKTLPVIFLSALDSEYDAHTGLSAGADVYLNKPVKSQLLKAQIHALMRREKMVSMMDTDENGIDSEFVKSIKELVYRHLGNKNLNIDMIAASLFISRATLYRKWAEESEVSIQNYILQTRLSEAQILIKERKFSISEAAASVGFSNSRYFTTAFKKEFGYSPSVLLKK
jgi:signal transduction histidine kinase/DNA-binding response OmpR family regulator